MKIGLVCPYNIFKGGGVQECVVALRDKLNSRGHEASIITPRPFGAPKKQPKGVIYIGTSVNVNSPFQATTAQGSIKIDQRDLAPMLNSHSFDVLHFHEPVVPFISRQIISKSNSAHVGTFHAKMPDTLIGKSVERVITPYAKSIIKSLDEMTAVSEAASEYVSSITDEKINIIPNGVDIQKYLPKKQAPKSKIKNILYVGRLERRKGVKYLIRAFEKLKREHPNVRLQIAGDGTDRAKLEAYVESRDISGVQFLGHISERRKISLLQKTSLFCSPAIFGESFGIVLLEAMAAGAVIVAGNNSGYSAVMKDRGTLSLVDPKNIAEFSRRLELLLFDDDLREGLISWSSEYVNNFDYEKVTDMYVEAYESAIKRSSLSSD